MPLHHVRLLMLFHLIMVSSQSFDPSLSNGTCWYSNDEPADKAYIPCGNDAFGYQTCCQARDICLSSRACYNGQYGVTYLAGCTDPTYKDTSVCPQKGTLYTQQWVGLVRCHVSNDIYEQDEEWAGCLNKQAASQLTVQSAAGCLCNTGSSTALFTDAPVLTNIASLPVKAGNDIAWFPGFSPVTLTDDSSTTMSATTLVQTILITRTSDNSVSLSTSTAIAVVTGGASSSYTVTPNDTPTVTGQASPTSFSDPRNTTELDSPLSTGSKVGIGVGSAGGAVLIGALLIWLAFWLRRRKTQKPPIPAIDQIRPRSPVGPYGVEPGDKHESVSEAIRSSLWLGHKAELPAESAPPSTVNSSVPAYTHSSLAPRESVITNGSSYRAYSPRISEVEGSSPGRIASPVPRPVSTRPAYEKNVYEMPA